MSDDGLQPVKRVFKFGDKTLEDPGPHMNEKQVMKMYATMYPSLTDGEIAGPFYDEGNETYKLEGKGGGTPLYEFKRKFGTKG